MAADFRKARRARGAVRERPRMSELLHPTYLPFTSDQLRARFAPVEDETEEKSERRLAHYRESIAARAALDASGGLADQRTVRAGRQMEKDERFWVAAALMALYHLPEPAARARAFCDLLERARLAPPPGFSDWPAALAGQLELYFEPNLPSPRAYQDWLRLHLASRLPVPHLREQADRAGRLEGPTKVDALLISTHTNVAVLFEAKVLSDVSTHVTFDVARNQLARNLDVMLDSRNQRTPLKERRADLTSLVLLTPGAFRDDPGLRHSRLYGFLFDAYTDPSTTLLARHLPHRDRAELTAVPARLGWASWEDCAAVVPGACPWLLSNPA